MDDEPLHSEISGREAFTPGWNKSFRLKEALPIKTSDGRIVRKVREQDEESITESELVEGENSQDNCDQLERKNHSVKREKDTINPLHLTADVDSLKMILGDICTDILADPEKSLSKSVRINDSEKPQNKLKDLLVLLKHPSVQVQELVSLSCLLVFKDICPGYRIRIDEGADKDVMLKKETKKLRDSELSLLRSYQTYLKFLEVAVQTGLGKLRHQLSIEWNPIEKLALSCLRCQCELLRSNINFNFRSNILKFIVNYGCHLNSNISKLCNDTLVYIFTHDTEGEVSFETIRCMEKALASAKYDVPESFLRSLESVKLRVHADEASEIRKKAKQERRKRKRQQDDVETGLLEADGKTAKSNILRFQADSLHEICLIYFRIVKMKVGFRLLPIALEGLSKISHLINIDTVNDLIVLMRKILEEKTPAAPVLVQLLCIQCAMKTLAGPGQELQVDDEIFVTSLRLIMSDLPITFENWDSVFECIDTILIKRREARNTLVLAFVRLLFVCSPHMSTAVTAIALALAHNILLRYPRARESLAILGRKAIEEDEIGDLAMRALKNQVSNFEENEGDGSWVLALYSFHFDIKFKPLLSALTSREVVAMPYRAMEARHCENISIFCDSLLNSFNLIQKTIHTTSVSAPRTNLKQRGGSNSITSSSEVNKLAKNRSILIGGKKKKEQGVKVSSSLTHSNSYNTTNEYHKNKRSKSKKSKK